MTVTRILRKVWRAEPTIEGAGVHLKRAFGNREAPLLDPFLLLDDFRSDDPSKYLPGFPWHPHRGIETITYVLAGSVNHADSLGNRGSLGAGDVQWMTAGCGVVHSGMPEQQHGRMRGFQLWVNLPARLKLQPAAYQEHASANMPVELREGGVRVKVIDLRA